ncbi:MAG: hypothetical protein IKP10_01740 [Clostridia bacterium]|nr:hypothetical protein [Clostridia bacterium]
MENPDALAAYIAQISGEREDYLRQRTARQADAGADRMSRDGRGEWIRSEDFSRRLWQEMRRDKVWQTLRRGELIQDFHKAEFERLRPLIESELRHGHAVDLPFLRSVSRGRLTLARAYAAVNRVEQHAARNFFRSQQQRFVNEADRRVEHALRHDDLTALLSRGNASPRIMKELMEGPFHSGIPEEMTERAFFPGSLTAALQDALYRAFPEFSACRGLVLPGGARLTAALEKDVQRARGAVCAEVSRRFPAKRIRRLLGSNPSVSRLQRRSDAARRQEEELRSALLSAIPERFCDLYPMARAMKRRFVLHLGPTNSGKTYDGVSRLCGARRGIYLGPLRLLAAEQADHLNQEGVPCSLVTGEERILVPMARVQSSTVEMASLKTHYDIAVIDECQMVADRDRGGAWTDAILGLCADEIHACASPDAEDILTRMIAECGDEVRVVRHERMTPLVMEKASFQFPDAIRPGDALIVFSKARVHSVAAELRQSGFRVSLIYGALPPDVRRDQAERFRVGDSDVVVSTDAIAMGMNLPIKRVVFLEAEKFDGDITRPLTDAEFKQIAGRAGRFGIYDTGLVNAFGFRGMVGRALSKTLPPVTEAVIRFPGSLLGLPLPLTETIRQWVAMRDQGFFVKASTQRMMSLATMLETPHTDKELLYRFICIPFDETEPALLERWRAMYRAESHHEHWDVLADLPEMIDPESCRTGMLDGLEADYRRCDLGYNYARLFLEDPDPVLEQIQQRKDLISRGIIHILSTQRPQEKRCAVCGRRLAWNWPHRLCDDCHTRQRRGYAGR